MSWAEFELKRLQDNQKFLKKVSLVIAIFGCIFTTWFSIYFIDYSLDMMKSHPYPERLIILIGFFVGMNITVDVFTVLYYLAIRKSGAFK